MTNSVNIHFMTNTCQGLPPLHKKIIRATIC